MNKSNYDSWVIGKLHHAYADEIKFSHNKMEHEKAAGPMLVPTAVSVSIKMAHTTTNINAK